VRGDLELSISVPPALEDVKSAQFTVLAKRLSANNSIPTDQNRLEFFDQKGDRGKAASYILNPRGIHIYLFMMRQSGPPDACWEAHYFPCTWVML